MNVMLKLDGKAVEQKPDILAKAFEIQSDCLIYMNIFVTKFI